MLVERRSRDVRFVHLSVGHRVEAYSSDAGTPSVLHAWGQSSEIARDELTCSQRNLFRSSGSPRLRG